MGLPVNAGDLVDGSYVIERLLGQGGMGAVFLARDERLTRRVAIKFLLPAVASNTEAVARFEREARAAAALQSEHVTHVHAVGRHESGAPYIVMEYLEGEDLAGLRRRRGPLPLHEVIGIIAQAGDAIAEAHALGIVHRDLKPANLFLARRANGAVTVKVLDFGISKVGPSTAAGLTATRALMGSPLYMSPEQLREARNVDGRADIWALGVTMYELLTGRRPFEAETLPQICTLVLTSAPAPPSAHRPELPAALDAVVLRCLQKDPAARFATVGEMVAALGAVRAAGSGGAITPPPTHGFGGGLAPPPAPPAPVTGAQTGSTVAAGTIDPVASTSRWREPRSGAVGLLVGVCAAIFLAGVALFGVFVVRSRGMATATPADTAGVLATAPADPGRTNEARTVGSPAPPSAGPASVPPVPSASSPRAPAAPVAAAPAGVASASAPPTRSSPTPPAPPPSVTTATPARAASAGPARTSPDFPMPADRR